MRISIVEVGPRDGFQMEKVFIPTDLKIKIINAISRTGVRKIEATSFVSPRMIPQMADAAEVMRGIERAPGVIYTALVPNLKGAQRAVDAEVGGVRFVLCATETYNQRNISQSIAQSLEECGRIIKFLESSGVPGEIIIGLAFGCPLEGPVEPRQVVSVMRALFELGYREFAIADTIGVANPVQVRSMMQTLRGQFPGAAFSAHFHDTRGLGLANILAAMEAGIDTFDSSIGGLGGCPVVPGASGNVSTEDLANMLNEMGIETGVSTAGILDCSRMIQGVLGRALPSHVLQAGTREQLFQRLAHRVI